MTSHLGPNTPLEESVCFKVAKGEHVEEMLHLCKEYPNEVPVLAVVNYTDALSVIVRTNNLSQSHDLDLRWTVAAYHGPRRLVAKESSWRVEPKRSPRAPEETSANLLNHRLGNCTDSLAMDIDYKDEKPVKTVVVYLDVVARILPVDWNSNLLAKSDERNYSCNPVLQDLVSGYHLKRFCDFSLVCRDVSYACHRFVLASRSEVFNSIFEESPEATQLELNGYLPLAVGLFVDFIYDGIVGPQVGDDVKALSDLLLLEHRFKVEDFLHDQCVELLLPLVDPSNFKEISKLAYEHEWKRLIVRLNHYYLDFLCSSNWDILDRKLMGQPTNVDQIKDLYDILISRTHHITFRAT